ncbi:MAG: DNA/RNA non-specific endonuclease [Prolixibacteraceae bacterium]
MKPNLLLTLLLSLSQTLTFSQTTHHQNSNPPVASIPHLEIPKTLTSDQIVHHTAYTLNYSEPNEQAQWVAYLLTKEHVSNKVAKRTNKFIIDPLVSTGSANNSDYLKSGYDKGHLAPAGDMSWSSIAMAESFYFSNMSPQTPAFNRGIWNKLEAKVRDWAIEYDSLYIVVGGIFKDNQPTIGTDKVSVPKSFYKVILKYSRGDVKGIGFLIPNKGSDQPLQSFACSINSIEALTGIDFYPLLPDAEETAIESKVCLSCWDWDQ